MLLVLSVVVGWPLSWFLPTLGDPWYQRVLLWISFVAITLTSADVLATTDVRAQDDDDSTRDAQQPRS